MILFRSGWTLTGWIKPDLRCRMPWKRKGATRRPQRLSKSSCCRLLSWLNTKGLPQLWLFQRKNRPQVSLEETFVPGSEAISSKQWCGCTDLFSPKGNLIHPWKENCGAAWSFRPHHASQVVNKYNAQRESVGAERAVRSPLTPNTSPNCQYNESWESCWPRIRCQGEVARGEKCQKYWLLPSWPWKEFVPVSVCTQVKASLNYSGVLWKLSSCRKWRQPGFACWKTSSL